MSQINVIKDPNSIKGLAVIEPTIHGDARGYFVETYNQNDMSEAGLIADFVQDNQSKSCQGVLRGLHFQKKYPQCKLVRALSGSVYDVAVDIRPLSETYGKYYGIVLSSDNFKQLFIPEGFAHGFLTLSSEAILAYKCTDFYHPNDDGGLAWNDTDVAVDWPFEQIGGIENVILSEKDKLNPTLKEIEAGRLA
jgi:dTDP-4-dehydrorhamnose 3,5-epimerase